MLRQFICLITALSLAYCLICNNYVFAYENPIEAVADSFDGTSLVEQGCIALKNNIPNYRFCYAYDYDGDGLQEGYAISGIWEEGIENGDLWFIDSDGTYKLVKKGLYCHVDLLEPELVYAGNQIFLILNQMQNGRVISLVCGYRNGNAYFPSISEQVADFHLGSGHYYAYDVTDYSGEEYLYSERTGEFINIRNNIPKLDFRNILSQNNWADIAYILDRWYGDEIDYNNNFQLTYEFIIQQLYISWDNHIANDPKGLLNYPYYIEAEFIDSILKTNFNMNDDLIEKLHSEIYSNQYGNVGYYYNNYYYFNPPEGNLQGSLYSIEIIEQKDNAYKIKFVNNDLNSYGVNDPYTRGTYYCIFEVVNDEQGQSFKVHGISKYDNIQWPIKTIKVVLNGEEIEFDQPPVMINDRVMVPIRAVAEKMGDSVKWSEKDNSALIIHPDRMVVFKNNHNSVIIAKEPEFNKWEHYDLDVPAQIIGDRTLTPVRAIGECLGAEVEWDAETQTVNITSDKNVNKIITDETITKFNVYYSLMLKDNLFAEFSPEIREFYESRNGWSDAFIIWWDDWFIGIDNLISGEENNVYMLQNSLAEIFSELPDNKEINLSTEIEITNWLSTALSYLSYVDFTEIDKVVNISPHTANALSKFGNALDKAGLKLELTGVTFETVCKILSDYTTGITYIDLIRETLKEENINDEVFYNALDNVEKEYTNKVVNALANGAKNGVIAVGTFVIGEVTGGAFTLASFSKDTLNAIAGNDDKADSVKNIHCIYWFNEYIDKAELSIKTDVYTKPEKIDDYIKIFNFQKIIKKKLYQSMDMLKNSKDEYTVNRIQEQLKKIDNMSYIIWR